MTTDLQKMTKADLLAECRELDKRFQAANEQRIRAEREARDAKTQSEGFAKLSNEKDGQINNIRQAIKTLMEVQCPGETFECVSNAWQHHDDSVLEKVKGSSTEFRILKHLHDLCG